MDQDALIERLAAGEGFGGIRPQRIDTHISVIFLTADRAWKLKRALKTSYLDYRTVDRRRKFCELEVEINRRTAPDLYLGAVPVRRRRDGSLSTVDGGDGEIVEWLVCMRRFDENLLLSRMAEREPLGRDLCFAIGDAVARFHAAAARVTDRSAQDRIGYVLDENRDELARHAGDLAEPGAADRLDDACRAALDRLAPALDRRGANGFVRHCHGDLHLANICVMDGEPVLFDAIEFSEAISHIDVLFDLAFPLMDLIHRGQAGAANAVFNRYLYRTRDDGDLGLMPLFLALRAGIRAHVSAMAGKADDCRGYVSTALSMLEPRPPVLVAVSGLSGSGKSSVAAALAPALGPPPGAAILGSDPIRKRRMGVEPLTRLGPDGYTRDMDEAVYAEMLETAERALASGHAAVLDATFIRAPHREAAERIARQAGVPFAGIRLAADADTLLTRVRARTSDPSDATEAVLRGQLTATFGLPEWRAVDAARPLAAIVADCQRAIRDEAS